MRVSRYLPERARVYRGVSYFSFAVILQADQTKQAKDKNLDISRLFSPKISTIPKMYIIGTAIFLRQNSTKTA